MGLKLDFEGLHRAVTRVGTLAANLRSGSLRQGRGPGSVGLVIAAATGADADAVATVAFKTVRTDFDRPAVGIPGVASLYAAVAAAIDHVVDLTGVDADPWA